MLRRAVLAEVGAWDIELRFCEDLDFWLRCVAAGKKFQHVTGWHCLYRKNHLEAATRKTCAVLEAFAHVVERTCDCQDSAKKCAVSSHTKLISGPPNFTLNLIPCTIVGRSIAHREPYVARLAIATEARRIPLERNRAAAHSTYFAVEIPFHVRGQQIGITSGGLAIGAELSKPVALSCASLLATEVIHRVCRNRDYGKSIWIWTSSIPFRLVGFRPFRQATFWHTADSGLAPS